MADYYRRFIEGFSKIARPMTALLAKKVVFKWTLECQESFETPKKKLTTTPVFILLDVHKPFSLYCDASYTRLGCMLMQEGRVVAYCNTLNLGYNFFFFLLTKFRRYSLFSSRFAPPSLISKQSSDRCPCCG
jgi:hypothetical protein